MCSTILLLTHATVPVSREGGVRVCCNIIFGGAKPW